MTAREFSELLGEIRTRLEYTQVDGTQVPVKYVFLNECPWSEDLCCIWRYLLTRIFKLAILFISMREYMLPDEASDEREVLRAGGVDEFDLIVDPILRNLLDETRDFIDR